MLLSKLVLDKIEDIEVFINSFRSKIMRVMKEKKEPMTVKQIADEIGEVPAKVYYHVKKLEAIGVLYIKYTKQINGIVAKYYDFTADTFALSVPNTDEKTDVMRSQLMKEYGNYFDEAKQKFFDLNNCKEEINNSNVYIYVRETFSVDPKKADEFFDDLSTFMDQYLYKGKDAMDFSLFFSMIKKLPNNKKTKQK